MDKTDLIEFVKLFKESAEEPTVNEPEPKAETDEEETVKIPFSWFDAVEDRLFTLLIFLITSGYLFLFVTGQASILQSELQIFQKSQNHIHNLVIKFFDESYEAEEFEYKAYKEEKLKYDQYAARDELKLDWNVLSKSEIKCSNDLMKKTAELIREQIKIIQDLKPKDYKEKNKEMVISNNSFEEFKLMFDPITIEKVPLISEKLKDYLDIIYVTQIQKYFKSKFKNIHLEIFADDSPIMKSKHELLFLETLLESSELVNSNLGKKMKIISGIKEDAIEHFESSLKTILNDLKTTIQSIPIFPKKKKKESSEIKNEFDNETLKTNNAFIKFFNTFYSKQQQ